MRVYIYIYVDLSRASKMLQLECGLRTPVDTYLENLHFGLVEVVWEWARGTPFCDITGKCGRSCELLALRYTYNCYSSIPYLQIPSLLLCLFSLSFLFFLF